MKKYYFAVIAILLHLQVPAQLIKKGNECAGFGKFILGASIANFTAIPADGGKYIKDGRIFQIYTGEASFELLGTSLNSILMTFNDSNKLVSFSFIKFYKKNDSPRFEKEAKKYYDQLNNYIAEQLNRDGEKKIYYSSKKGKFIGNEWKGSAALLKLTKNISLYHSTIQLSFGEHGH